MNSSFRLTTRPRYFRGNFMLTGRSDSLQSQSCMKYSDFLIVWFYAALTIWPLVLKFFAFFILAFFAFFKLAGARSVVCFSYYRLHLPGSLSHVEQCLRGIRYLLWALFYKSDLDLAWLALWDRCEAIVKKKDEKIALVKRGIDGACEWTEHACVVFKLSLAINVMYSFFRFSIMTVEMLVWGGMLC